MLASLRNLVDDGALPSDPKWVAIGASDGDQRRWPLNTTITPDSAGFIHYMQPLSLDSKTSIKWRLIIGQALAQLMNYPDLESKTWVLKNWPVGYKLYDQHKGQKDGRIRHDIFLIGSDTIGRFCSPAEFIPHAYWLMTDPTQDRSNCECKYCAKKPQRAINEKLSLLQRQSSLKRFAELPRDDENKKKDRYTLPAREGRVSIVLRRAPKPAKLPKGPKQHVSPERDKDLRALFGPKTLGERRWAREGELVWVKLDFPIPVEIPDGHSERISFWPGVIEEAHFKADIAPRRGSTTDAKTAASSCSNALEDNTQTIVHRAVYKINLLVTSKTVIYGSDHILPYQSYAPDENLLTAVKAVMFDLDDFANKLGGIIAASDSEEDAEYDQAEQAEQDLFKRFQSFDPFPDSEPQHTQCDERTRYFETAAGAFAVAIQIASRLTMYWTSSDVWEYKMQLPLTSHDSTADRSLSSGTLSQTDQHTLGQRAPGLQQASNVGYTTQMRFQGLWWGPERIWMGDLVRLKLGRYQMVPEGTRVVKKPSGARNDDLLDTDGVHLDNTLRTSSTDSSTDIDSVMHDVDFTAPINDSLTTGVSSTKNNGNDNHVRDVGAALRSLFLRIDGFFSAQVPSKDGVGVENECRMSGKLYELADDDWDSDGEEINVSLLPKKAKKEPLSQTESKSSLATPLRAIMSSKPSATLADVINQNASRQSHLPSSSLFTPNPELLSEPAPLVDAVMSEALQDRTDLHTSTPLLSTNTLPSLIDRKDNLGTSIAKDEPPPPNNPSLSGPLEPAESAHSTPPPPSGMKFRPILLEGYEAVLPLTTLAGRYYSGLLSNPLLRSQVQHALENPEARDSKAIRALEGFVPGVYNSVDSTHFLPVRARMLREAERLAWEELVDYWKRQMRSANANATDGD